MKAASRSLAPGRSDRIHRPVFRHRHRPADAGRCAAKAGGDRAPRREGDRVGPVYKPPLRGAPGGRVGGGTRGTGREAFILSVLAPAHTGLTTREQPVLYWFISSASSHPVELTLVDPQKGDPLVELRIEPPVAAGVHRVRLADHGVRLASRPYNWYVAVMPDTGRRSKDILAGGSVERVVTRRPRRAKVSQAPKADLPTLYAEAGLWYDAMAAHGELIEQSPRSRPCGTQRSALLRQVVTAPAAHISRPRTMKGLRQPIQSDAMPTGRRMIACQSPYIDKIVPMSARSVVSVAAYAGSVGTYA